MRLHGTLFCALLLVACGGGFVPGTGDGGSPGTPWTGGGGSTGGGGTTGGGTTDRADAGLCGIDMQGASCTTGTSCSWSRGCDVGECLCLAGHYSCSRQGSCDSCPGALNTPCGTACNTTATNCLCRCGGGPNYTSCTCTGGSWLCRSTTCGD